MVEENLKLQDAIRTKFKELGWRVLMSAEPARALQRLRLPFRPLRNGPIRASTAMRTGTAITQHDRGGDAAVLGRGPEPA